MGGGREGHGVPTPLTLRLCQGLSRETAKRLRFVPGLVYVDGKDRARRARAGGLHPGVAPSSPRRWSRRCLAEGAVRGQSPAQRQQNLTRMETLLQATGFPYHLTHLEQVRG